MDPNLRHRRRQQLILGKFPVVEIGQGFLVLNIRDKFALRINQPPGTDIRHGDILTLYTEVLVKEKPNA